MCCSGELELGSLGWEGGEGFLSVRLKGNDTFSYSGVLFGV